MAFQNDIYCFGCLCKRLYYVNNKGEIANMLKIFLSSHGRFASGIKSSLDILLGGSAMLTVFDAYLDDRSVSTIVDEFYDNVKPDDQVLLLSDLLGGSVNQVLCQYLNKPNTILVTGINLAFVLEVAIRDSISEKEIDEIIKQSREALKMVKIDFDNEENTEEFF